jgi:energy-coupling factor transporter ATP-binding protein EcfA2
VIVQNAAQEATASSSLPLYAAGAIALLVVWIMRKEIARGIAKLIAQGIRGTVMGLVKARSVMWPLYAGMLVGVVVIVLRSSAPAFWWTLALVGVAAGGFAAWKGGDLYRRVWLTADAVVFGLYGAWMVAAGVTGAGLLAGLGLGIAGNVPLWLGGRVSGDARIMARLQADRWRQWTEARELKGLKRGRITRTPMGIDVVVSLGGKLTVEALNARIRHIEAGLGARRGSVRIEAHEMAHKCTVRIQTKNPLKKLVPWTQPTGPVSITEPARVSMNAFGEWTEIDLQQRILIVGASGSGKSSVQRVLSAPVILAEDADLEVWDLKEGLESQHYEGKAIVRITNAQQARDRIDWYRSVEFPRRAAIMKKLNTNTWPTSFENRDRIVQVDEGAALVRALDDEELADFFTFLEQARAFGIYLWWATQFPKSTNLPTELRSQMSAIVALKMRRGSESRVVFEDLTKEGWTPHRLAGKGWLMLMDDEHAEPTETRAAFIDEKQFRKIEAVHGVAPAAPAAPVVPPLPSYAPFVPAQHDYDAEMDEAISLAKTGPSERPAAVAEPELEELAVTDAILTALADAPAAGESAGGLQLSTGRGKSQVYAALQELQDDGLVVKLGRGKYALSSADAGQVEA